MPVKRYDISAEYEGQESTNGYLQLFQIRQLLDSMPVGAALIISRIEDTEDKTVVKINTKIA